MTTLMPSISSKNLLQEYCQKNKYAMPKYESWSNHGPKQNPLECEWHSKVTIMRDGKTIVKETPTSSSTKIGAEKRAAKVMLEEVQVQVYVTKSLKPPDLLAIENIYLIDLENKPQFKANYNDASLYIGFINAAHATVPKYTNWHFCNTDDIQAEINKSGNCRLAYSIDGGTPDLADHLMTALCYAIINALAHLHAKVQVKIYVISGDHAGWCTTACLNKLLSWKAITNVTIYNQSQICSLKD